MKNSLLTELVAAAAIALGTAIATPSASAQSILIDDFSTDPSLLFAQEFSRDAKTGEIKESITVVRRTDKVSVKLVDSFLRDDLVVLVLPDDRRVEARIDSYSRNTSGDRKETETFTFSVEREMKESGEKGGAAGDWEDHYPIYIVSGNPT